MTELLLALLKLSVAALILAVGMGFAPADVTYLWRQPALLIRSLLAMYVLVPLVALALVRMLPHAPEAEAALLVLAVSAGAPLLPRRLSGLGGGPYLFSLVVTSSLAAVVAVPVWLALLGRHFAVEAELRAAAVAGIVGRSLLLPLAAGMLLRALLPAFAARFGDRLLGLAGSLLALAALALLAMHVDLLLDVRLPGVAALLGFGALALAIGHVLGGPDPHHRTALAIACATRHLAIAVLVAASFPGPRTAVVVAGYFLAAVVVSIPYLRWRRAAAG